MNEINILKINIKDLQTQLQSAYILIKELNEELFESKNHDTDSTK